MKTKTKIVLISFIILCGACFAVSKTQAATVTCNFIWPQQVVINGTAYSCDVGAGRGYCNYTKAQQGIAECCDWHEGAGYSNCASIGPTCTENWSCGTWSDCLIPICNTWPSCPTQQTRTCTDANNCGTTVSKPAVAQSCTVTCTDTDNGQDFYTKGSTTGIDTWKQYKIGTETDYCSGNSAVEFYCYNAVPDRPYINYGSMTCANGCADGACKKAGCTENWSCTNWSMCNNSQQTRTCTDANSCGTTASKPATSQTCSSCADSDNGNEIYTKGSTTGNYPLDNIFTAKTDYCRSVYADGHDANWLQEYFCYVPQTGSSYITTGSYYCSSGCADGACKRAACTEDWRCGGWSNCANGQQIRSCFDANNCGTINSKPATSQSCGCTEKWSCNAWSSCTNGIKTRTCTDANSCGTTVSKPVTQQTCQNQCEESWSCTDWSSCQNNQQTRTCTDTNSCGTVVNKPVLSQSCTMICTENWSCNVWSTCANNQQTRTCTDANNCGTTNLKPLTTQICGTVCTENWFCENWSICANKQQTRACKDLNNCGTVSNKPTTTQSCIEEQTTLTPNTLTPELVVTNPESNIFFGGITTLTYLPGEVLKFYYKYQNITAETIKIRIVRQLVNAKGKAVASAQAWKTLEAGSSLSVEVKQLLAKSWPAGVYTVKVKIYNTKNKIIDENGFAIKLKKKYFVLNEMPADTDLAWDAKVWSQVKTNVLLPVNLKLRFSYTNNTDTKHVIKMVRELIDEKGNVKATKSSKWVMTVGEKDHYTFMQWLADSLSVGNYLIRIRAYDWTTKELLAENSAGFTVEAK